MKEIKEFWPSDYEESIIFNVYTGSLTTSVHVEALDPTLGKTM